MPGGRGSAASPSNQEAKSWRDRIRPIMRWGFALWVLSVLLYGGGGYLAAADVREAFADHDAETLSARIDFESVEARNRQRLAFMLEARHGELGPMAAVLSAALLTGDHLGSLFSADGLLAWAAQEDVDVLQAPFQMGWAGLDRIVAQVFLDDDSRSVVAEMRFAGGQWRVVDLVLPPDVVLTPAAQRAG